MSPTLIAYDGIIFIVFPLIDRYKDVFDYLSRLYLLKSSYAYLPKVKSMTIIKGER